MWPPADFDVVERLMQLGKEALRAAGPRTPEQGYTEVAIRLGASGVVVGGVRIRQAPPSRRHSGKGYTAHIPDAVLHANDRAVYAAFLRGLFEADGDTQRRLPDTEEHLGRMVARRPVPAVGPRLPDHLSVKDRPDGGLGPGSACGAAAAQPVVQRALAR